MEFDSLIDWGLMFTPSPSDIWQTPEMDKQTHLLTYDCIHTDIIRETRYSRSQATAYVAPAYSRTVSLAQNPKTSGSLILFCWYHMEWNYNTMTIHFSVNWQRVWRKNTCSVSENKLWRKLKKKKCFQLIFFQIFCLKNNYFFLPKICFTPGV